MNFKRSLKRNPLTEKERSLIEWDLTKSQMSFEQIAIKHNMFSDDIRNIAIEIGLIQDHQNEVKVDEIANDSGKRKYTKLSTEERLSLAHKLKDFSNNNWKDFNQSVILKEFGISYNTFRRIADSFHINLPILKRSSSSEETKLEKDELIPLSNFVNDKVLSVLLDEDDHISGIGYILYHTSLSKVKSDYDFEKPIANFFSKLVEGKAVSEIKVYTNYTSSSPINFKISSLLTKYCYYNKCNLTFMILGKESNVITDFNQPFDSVNINWIINKRSVEKFLYNCSFDEIIDSKTLYFVNLRAKRNQIIICKSYKDTVKYLYKFLLETEESLQSSDCIRLSGSITSLEDGKPTDIFNFTNSKIYT